MLIWMIGLGLFNFTAYTVLYAYIGGDARNGRVESGSFFVRGHFLHDLHGHDAEVSKPIWLYSYAHSVTIWPTIGVVLCAMLILAQPHIIATMHEDSLFRGRSFVTVSMTVIILVICSGTLYFLLGLIQAIGAIGRGENYGV